MQENQREKTLPMQIMFFQNLLVVRQIHQQSNASLDGTYHYINGTESQGIKWKKVAIMQLIFKKIPCIVTTALLLILMHQ